MKGEEGRVRSEELEVRSPEVTIPRLETLTLKLVWREPEGRNRPSAGVWGQAPPRIGFSPKN